MSKFDYFYPVIIAIVGILMIVNPRTFMRGAKYDEEAYRNEVLVKKIGIGGIVAALIIAAIIYFRMN